MGRATRLKKEMMAKAEADFQQKFLANSKESKANQEVTLPHVSLDFNDFQGFFIRDKESFVLKTRSNNRDKQRKEFVRHVFNLYPVPEFMYRAWDTPIPRYQNNWARVYGRPQRNHFESGFATRLEYRLWYICIATGGSFFKEYGQCLFTKKECHTFLNCQHDIPIDEAIVYAIAYTESQNMGKALKISKSKLSDCNLENEFWKEVVKFFARQEPKSKEQIDDIVDYIIFKKTGDENFTIIGKGHTLDSLSDKVENWHRDLRRLKAIGEAVWHGIDVKDYEYKKTNSDGSQDVWKFTQIKTAKDLQREGNAMRHCVLGYKSRCIDGSCSIWSMTINGNRKLTIEVNKMRNVVQVRGLANRVARPDERNIVWYWAKASGFYYDR